MKEKDKIKVKTSWRQVKEIRKAAKIKAFIIIT